MRMPSAVGAASMAIALFAGGFAIGHGVHKGSSHPAASPKRGAEVLGNTFARTPDTTTTSAPSAPGSPEASPTAQASTPTTASSAASARTRTTTASSNTGATTGSSSTGGTTATTTQTVSGACGTGGAKATLQSRTAPRQPTATTDYETDVVVTVTNGVDKAIQIDVLSIRVVWSDGTPPQPYTFDQANGSVLQPGQAANFGVALRTATPPSGVELTNFTFHTAGQPQCTGKPA